jgi:ABC-2 type transport system permease protein
MPFFMFFSFSVRREMEAAQGVARLLALTTFFTASSAGPVIIPMERRIGTYDRLLAAPMSLVTLLLGKTLVGAFFAIAVSMVPLLAGLLWLRVVVAEVGLLLAGLALASLAFSVFGLAFASIPARSVGNIMMPSTLIRWPLLFISGVFIPLEEMAPAARAAAYLSPLTYAQDLMNRALQGTSALNPWLDLAVLLLMGGLFLLPSVKLHQRSRRLGY